MNQVPTLSDHDAWPREAPPSFVERGRPPVYDTDPFTKYDEQLVGRLQERVKEARSQIATFESLITDWKDKIALYEDLKKQELEKITKAEAAIAQQKTLQPVQQRVSLSARQQLLDQIGHLYTQSAASGESVTFSVNPSVLDSCASDRGVVDNREFPNARSYVRGVFGVATFDIDFTFAQLVERARSLQGKQVDVRRNELGF